MSIVPAHLFPSHLNAALGYAEAELHRAILRLAAPGPLAPADRPRRRELIDLVRGFLRLVSVHKTFQGLDPEIRRIPSSRRTLLLPPALLATLPPLESALTELLPQSPDQPWDAPEFRVPWTLLCRLIAVRRELGPAAPPSGFPALPAPPSPPGPSSVSNLKSQFSDPASPDPAPAAPLADQLSDRQSAVGVPKVDPTSPAAPVSPAPDFPAAPPVGRVSDPTSPIAPSIAPPSSPDTPAPSSLSNFKSQISNPTRPSSLRALFLICVHRCGSVVETLSLAFLAACLAVLRGPAVLLALTRLASAAWPALLEFALRRLSFGFAPRLSVPQLLARPQPP